MNSMPHDFDALAAFFDPAAVAATLKEMFDTGPIECCQGGPGTMPARSPVATAADQDVLRRLLLPEVYDYWREAGYTGSYCMTFMLRHAVCFLALACHENACPSQALAQAMESYFPHWQGEAARECAALLEPGPAQGAVFPLLGFSALGIHAAYRQAGLCRSFDYYTNSACPEPAAGLFCGRHAAEAWWVPDRPRASTQADMLRFYAEKQNLYAYDERELQELVGRFWSHLKQFRGQWAVSAEAEAAALNCFGYQGLPDLIAGGQPLLRRRYAERARQLHPDAGGGHELFVSLKNSYDVLRCRLNCEQAVQPSEAL